MYESCYCFLTDVSVPLNVCAHGDVRLEGGSVPSEGRLEYCYRGEWTILCSYLQSPYVKSFAAAACRHLNLPHKGKVMNPLPLRDIFISCSNC